MNCWNCGKEVQPGQRFCDGCGADLSRGPQQTPPQGPGQNWQAPPQGPDPGSLNENKSSWSGQNGGRRPGGKLAQYAPFLLTVFGIVFAVYYGYQLLRRGGSVLYLLRLFLGGYYGGYVWLVIQLIISAVNIILNVLAMAVSILIACRRTRENTDGLFVCFAGIALIRAPVYLILSILSLLLSGWGNIGFGRALTTLLAGVLQSALLFVLYWLNGETPVVGKSTEQISASIHSIFDSFSRPAGGAAPGSPGPYAGNGGPLKTNRSLLVYILLNLVTCGLYSFYFLYNLIRDMNTVCAGDGEETPGLLKLLVFGVLTCSIYGLIWYYNLGNRMQKNAPRYGLAFPESGSTLLLWILVGVLLCGIGPLIAMHIIIKNMNSLCDAYNRYNGFS